MHPHQDMEIITVIVERMPAVPEYAEVLRDGMHAGAGPVSSIAR